MDDPSRAGAIPASFASREGEILAASILGTTDPQRVVENLDAFCATCLGSPVEEAFLCELSVGAAFGLRDERRVMLKVHPSGRALRFLRAVYLVQRHLFARGFPCPEPITGPRPFGHGLATVEAFVDEGEFADAHEPEIRREMARTLDRMIELSATVPDVRALSQAWKLPPARGLWPVPHNALFDFEATAAGAEWIDEIAGRARETLATSPGKVVVGHSDWSGNQMRFEGGKVSVGYDWDSLSLDKETNLVGHTATHFPYTEYFDVPRRASPAEARLFVEEYETARGT